MLKVSALILLALPAFAQTPVAEPSQFYSAGAGVSGLGPAQVFGYYSISQRIAAGTYTTEINEFARVKGGTVATCARAGVSKAMWGFGAFTVGVVGDAGACEGANGSASGAVAARSFITARLGKTAFHFVGTGETLSIAGSGRQTVISIGIGYGR